MQYGKSAVLHPSNRPLQETIRQTIRRIRTATRKRFPCALRHQMLQAQEASYSYAFARPVWFFIENGASKGTTQLISINGGNTIMSLTYVHKAQSLFRMLYKDIYQSIGNGKSFSWCWKGRNFSICSIERTLEISWWEKELWKQEHVLTWRWKPIDCYATTIETVLKRLLEIYEYHKLQIFCNNGYCSFFRTPRILY